MAEKMEDIVGSIFESNSYGIVEVLEYIGKTDSNHMYRIKFVNTGNTKYDSRASIKRKSCVDDKEQERIRYAKKQKEIEDRKKLNAIKGKEIIETSKQYCRILSLDQSTNGCAWSLFINDSLISFGKIDTSKCLCATEKIILIRDTVKKFIKDHHIDVLVIEDIYMYFNVDVFKTLAILYGTLQLLAYECDIHFLSQQAFQWKSGVGINLGKHDEHKKKRNYQKRASIEKVKEIYNQTINDDDICDSILIGLYTAWNCIKYVTEVKMGEWV